MTVVVSFQNYGTFEKHFAKNQKKISRMDLEIWEFGHLEIWESKDDLDNILYSP